MLDIQFIRENEALLQEVAEAKGVSISIRELLEVDVKRRALLQEVEALRSHRNAVSKRIAKLVAKIGKQQTEQTGNPGSETLERETSNGTDSGAYTSKAENPEILKDQARETNAKLVRMEADYAATETRFLELMLWVPNIISPDTPKGASDAENVELKRVGFIPDFGFEPKNHVELMERFGMLDIPRGVKVAGSRGYFLKDAGLHLHRAVQQLAVDLLVDCGFSVMDVPVLIREEVMRNTGFFPAGREQTYELERDNQWLAGTSEGALVSYYADEIVDVTEPIRLAAVSNCFRREAGGAGRDVHGLYRVHQFAKVEQVVICKGDLEVSNRMFEELTRNAEDLLRLLELPYRVVAVCTGDLS